MWCALVSMNLGILFVINFADLTIGMLMVHLFTYDPAWFQVRLRALERNKRNGQSLVQPVRLQ